MRGMERRRQGKNTVRAELVEALVFALRTEEMQGFDRLSPNGCGDKSA